VDRRNQEKLIGTQLKNVVEKEGGDNEKRINNVICPGLGRNSVLKSPRDQYRQRKWVKTAIPNIPVFSILKNAARLLRKKSRPFRFGEKNKKCHFVSRDRDAGSAGSSWEWHGPGKGDAGRKSGRKNYWEKTLFPNFIFVVNT